MAGRAESTFIYGANTVQEQKCQDWNSNPDADADNTRSWVFFNVIHFNINLYAITKRVIFLPSKVQTSWYEDLRDPIPIRKGSQQVEQILFVSQIYVRSLDWRCLVVLHSYHRLILHGQPGCIPHRQENGYAYIVRKWLGGSNRSALNRFVLFVSQIYVRSLDWWCLVVLHSHHRLILHGQPGCIPHC